MQTRTRPRSRRPAGTAGSKHGSRPRSRWSWSDTLPGGETHVVDSPESSAISAARRSSCSAGRALEENSIRVVIDPTPQLPGPARETVRLRWAARSTRGSGPAHEAYPPTAFDQPTSHPRSRRFRRHAASRPDWGTPGTAGPDPRPPSNVLSNFKQKQHSISNEPRRTQATYTAGRRKKSPPRTPYVARQLNSALQPESQQTCESVQGGVCPPFRPSALMRLNSYLAHFICSIASATS